MLTDRNGLEILTRDACLDLLTTAKVGRLAVSVGALPAILPVHYGLLDGDIIVRTGPGTKLDAALRRTVVAFEVDAFGDDLLSGWSVLVQGLADVIRDVERIERAGELGLRPWGDPQRGAFVAIEPTMVTGRRIQAPVLSVAG